MTDRRRRIRAFVIATLFFVAYATVITWVYVHRANVAFEGRSLGPYRMNYVGMLVGLYAVGLSAYLVALARIR
jgi:Na+/alanine symporter